MQLDATREAEEGLRAGKREAPLTEGRLQRGGQARSCPGPAD